MCRESKEECVGAVSLQRCRILCALRLMQVSSTGARSVHGARAHAAPPESTTCTAFVGRAIVEITLRKQLLAMT